MSTLRASLDALDAWTARLPGCRIRRNRGLSDADIDAGFAALTPHHPSPPGSSARLTPRGSYREFLRICNGLAVEVEVDGNWTTVDTYMLQIFDLETVARVQHELVYFRSPEFVVGAGETKRRKWLSRNHLVAFAGGKYAPDALWVFNTNDTGDAEHRVYKLDQDAGFGSPLLLEDEHGSWVGGVPEAQAPSFAIWLADFVAELAELDPRDYA